MGRLSAVLALSLAACSSGGGGADGGTTGAAASTGAATASSTGATSASAASTSGAATSAGATTGTTAAATGATSGTGTSGTSGTGGGCAQIGEGNPCTTAQGIGGMCCGGQCIDPAHDPLNCTLCKLACPTGSACEPGGCFEPDGGLAIGCGEMCPEGTACVGTPEEGTCLGTTCAVDDVGADCWLDGGSGSCCGTACVDLGSDPQNCGFCGSVCGAGQTCSVDNGCSGTCPAGELQFGGACLPTTCNGEAQGQFDCAIDAGAFPDLGTCCGTACVDTIEDPSNCQVCGNVCPAGSFCNSGFCPLLSCAGAGAYTQCILPGSDAGVGSCCDDACVNTNTDSTACGGCGIACPLADHCADGVCDYPDSGFFECSTDPAACPPGTVCQDILCMALGCAGAQDGQSCAFGESSLVGETGECCGGRCIDPATDPQNCGACGFGSPDGVCVVGSAYPPPPDAGVCFACPAEEECDGPYCVDPGCLLGGVCFTAAGAPAACCFTGAAQVCTAVESDPANCGGCGFACPAGQSCTQGSCSGGSTACGAGLAEGYCNLDGGPSFLCCPGTGCTDTRSDPQNCGSCGVVCAGTCAAGACG